MDYESYQKERADLRSEEIRLVQETMAIHKLPYNSGLYRIGSWIDTNELRIIRADKPVPAGEIVRLGIAMMVLLFLLGVAFGVWVL